MRIHARECEIDVRAVTAADVPLLLSFIRRMAEFERLVVSATEADLAEALGGVQPAATALLAFVAGAPAAYVVYYFGLSTMTGKRVLDLEDIFVIPELRGRGIARALIAHLARIAADSDCARCEWIVLDWNERAIAFYEKLGAVVLPDWRVCRMEGDALARLAQPSTVQHASGGGPDAAN